MASHKNLAWFTISNTPGTTGDLVVDAAVDGLHVTMEAADDGKAFDVRIFENGAGSEVRRGCTYTHGTTTLTRGTLESTTGAGALNFTAAAEVMVTATADFGRRMESAALNHVAGADANTTMAVGALYVVDGATLTADRTYTLPAVAAVGDRIGVMMSAGSASYEVLLTAASGDTLNGVSGGTEWSRVFQAGEVVIMRCVAANATWVVDCDGRIPCAYSVYLTTSATGETAATWTDPTTKSGAWTVAVNAGSCGSNSKFTARRAGTYSIGLRGRNGTQHSAAGQYYGVAVFAADLATYQVYALANSPPTALFTAPSSNGVTTLAVAGEVNFRYISQDGSRGLLSFATAAYTSFSVVEVL